MIQLVRLIAEKKYRDDCAKFPPDDLRIFDCEPDIADQIEKQMLDWGWTVTRQEL